MSEGNGTQAAARAAAFERFRQSQQRRKTGRYTFAGVEFEVRSLSIGAFERLKKEGVLERIEKQEDLAASCAAVFAETLYDPETGEQVFRRADTEVFEGVDVTEITQAVRAVLDVSGLTRSAVAEAGKDSEPTT